MNGLAQLGDLTFRINPQEVSWNFQVYTNIVKTIGGRVVQVTGAALSDITVSGQYGEDHQKSYVWLSANNHTDSDKAPGRSWRLAEDFVTEIHRLMAKQSPLPGLDHTSRVYLPPKPFRFFYPARKWDFSVFIKAVSDNRGQGVVSHMTGKFSYGYQLTLIPVNDNTLHLAGKDSMALEQMKNAAISQAINRISDGIGWKETKFNDPGNQSNAADLNNPAQPVTPATPSQTQTQTPTSSPGSRERFT